MLKLLRLVLGDQLNIAHSWFKEPRPDVIYVMMEIQPEATYVKHHIQKVTGFFAAMRHFSEVLKKSGYHVHYIYFDDPANKQSFEDNLLDLIKKFRITKFEYQEPDEYRLEKLFENICRKLPVSSQIYSSEHFYTTRADLKVYFRERKNLLLESFYRHMRKKHDVLIQNGQPIGDKWNFDKLNRRSVDKSIELKDFVLPTHNVSNIAEMLKKAGIEMIGDMDPLSFRWPVNRSDSLAVLEYFLKNNLHHFGTYQDAMDTRSPFLFHSLLSFALNTKMISPKEVVDRSISYWYDNSDKVSIAQIEGFVRQILGWREFMRGIYWTYMPEYREMNFFKHSNKLPDFYWSGDTRMRCLKYAIEQSLNYAYAHHIQRLMLTGNFALLAGVDPDEVDQWYLGIYIDAIEWVEVTNTRGMSQYADGGIVGTKPYVSSANYINKMSNYCRDCSYDRKIRYGKKACPFNSFYWNFFIRHHDLLADNMRTKMAYVNLKKMSSQEILSIKKQASKYLNQIDHL